MPSGERYRLAIYGRKLDLSAGQYFMLKAKTPINPASKDHNTLQRLEGLRRQGLLTKREGKFVRTALAKEVLVRLSLRTKKRVSNK